MCVQRFFSSTTSWASHLNFTSFCLIDKPLLCEDKHWQNKFDECYARIRQTLHLHTSHKVKRFSKLISHLACQTVQITVCAPGLRCVVCVFFYFFRYFARLCVAFFRLFSAEWAYCLLYLILVAQKNLSLTHSTTDSLLLSIDLMLCVPHTFRVTEYAPFFFSRFILFRLAQFYITIHIFVVLKFLHPIETPSYHRLGSEWEKKEIEFLTHWRTTIINQQININKLYICE